MATRGLHILMFASALMVVINAFEPKGMLPRGLPTPEDCERPPMKRLVRECCTPPKEKIWGDLKGSLNSCMKKAKRDPNQGPEIMRQEAGEGEPEMMTPDGLEVATSTEGMSDSASTPGTYSTTEGFTHRHRGPHMKKPLSERVKNLFSTVYRELKNTFDALWQSVVIIADHFHRFKNDSCFMECVFEDQGFLVNKKPSKDALLARFGTTLKANEPWHTAAVGALDTCFSGLQAPTSGSCQSGSEEIFRCVFKQLFLNCPNWVQNDYCTSLKDFYQKCPEGPPPEAADDHTTMAPEDMESAGATETLN